MSSRGAKEESVLYEGRVVAKAWGVLKRSKEMVARIQHRQDKSKVTLDLYRNNKVKSTILIRRSMYFSDYLSKREPSLQAPYNRVRLVYFIDDDAERTRSVELEVLDDVFLFLKVFSEYSLFDLNEDVASAFSGYYNLDDMSKSPLSGFKELQAMLTKGMKKKSQYSDQQGCIIDDTNVPIVNKKKIGVTISVDSVESLSVLGDV